MRRITGIVTAAVLAIATATAVPEEAGDPAGDLLFEIDGLPDSETSRNPAVWDLPTAEMPPGEYTLIATFKGNEAFGESVSEKIDFTVLPASGA